MSEPVRHRVVTCLSRIHLEEEIKRYANEGWRIIGEPALAVPVELERPPYWTQAMYLSPKPIAVESVKIAPPTESKLPNQATKDWERA